MSKEKKPTPPSADNGYMPANATIQKCPLALKTNLGDEADKAIEKCPKFAQNLNKLQDDGWSFEYGTKDGGSYCDKNAKKIVVDTNEKGNTATIVETMAHESGHALYSPDPYILPDGLTKQEYAAKNANSSLKDEGEATLTNIEMKNCLKANGGMDIGVAGVQSAEYEKIAAKYPDAKDRDKARQKIGDIFADNEHPSTDPAQTYREYYEKSYNDFYDKLPVDKKTVKNP